MIPWVQLSAAVTPAGTPLTLWQHGTDWSIRAGTAELMSSRMHGSEEVMASLARAERPGARVLVGGLGMGFTLRAALDVLPEGGRVTVVELVAAVVDWNRGPLAPLAGHPLQDPRVDVVVGDVGATLKATPGAWDTILLDVDNGPEGLTQPGNDALYGVAGLRRAREALRPGGALAVWSAHPSPAFEKRLAQAGFRVEVHHTRARAGGKGPRHTIFLGRHQGRPPPR